MYESYYVAYLICHQLNRLKDVIRVKPLVSLIMSDNIKIFHNLEDTSARP